MSSLLQDAVFSATDMTWRADARQFALLLNRFRWEDDGTVAPERVRALLVFDDVMRVASQGISRKASDLVLSLLSISWQPGSDGTGRFELVLAGDGALALEVECINVVLKDVTRPYLAPSRKTPKHPE